MKLIVRKKSDQLRSFTLNTALDISFCTNHVLELVEFSFTMNNLIKKCYILVEKKKYNDSGHKSEVSRGAKQMFTKYCETFNADL